MSIVKRILGQDKNRGDVVEGRKDSPRYRSLPKLLRKTHIISRLRTYLSGRTTSGNTHHICLDIPAIRAVPGCPSVGYKDLVFALRLRGVVDKVLLWPGSAMSCCLFHADCSVWPLDGSEALLNSYCSLQRNKARLFDGNNRTVNTACLHFPSRAHRRASLFGRPL